MANTYTYLEAQTAVYQRLRSNISDADQNQVYPLTQVKQWINDGQYEALNAGEFTFMNKTVSFDTSIDTTLGEAITTTDTSFNVSDASGLLTSGKVQDHQYQEVQGQE